MKLLYYGAEIRELKKLCFRGAISLHRKDKRLRGDFSLYVKIKKPTGMSPRFVLLQYSLLKDCY